MLKDDSAVYLIGVVFSPLIVLVLVLILLQACECSKEPSRPTDMDLFNHGMHKDPMWMYSVEIP